MVINDDNFDSRITNFLGQNAINGGSQIVAGVEIDDNDRDTVRGAYDIVLVRGLSRCLFQNQVAKVLVAARAGTSMIQRIDNYTDSQRLAFNRVENHAVGTVVTQDNGEFRSAVECGRIVPTRAGGAAGALSA